MSLVILSGCGPCIASNISWNYPNASIHLWFRAKALWLIWCSFVCIYCVCYRYRRPLLNLTIFIIVIIETAAYIHPKHTTSVWKYSCEFRREAAVQIKRATPNERRIKYGRVCNFDVTKYKNYHEFPSKL